MLHDDDGGPFPFDAPFPWSLLKLEILEKYTNALATIIGTNRPVCFVDLMAGEGYYRTGDGGSAGRLAEIARRHRDAGRSVRVIAIEADDVAFRHLEQNTEHVRDFVAVRHAEWQAQVPQLLAELQGEFAFFFVDPMGIKQIPWSSLGLFINRPDSELLINFNSSIAARVAGIVLNSGRAHEAFERLLDDVMNGNAWKDGAEQARDRSQLPAHLTEAYVRAIGQSGSYTVCWTPIAKNGDRGLLKYHLVFASRHMKAFAVMNDILAEQQERLERERALAPSEVPMLLPRSPDEYDAERSQMLVNELASSLAVDATLRSRVDTIEGLRLAAFTARFGKYKLMMYAPAVTLLVDQERATVVGEEKRRKGQLQLAVRVRL